MRPPLFLVCCLAISPLAEAQEPSLPVWPPSPSGPETIYSPPGAASFQTLPAEAQRLLAARVAAGYASESVWRGISRTGSESGGNYQFDSRLTLDPDAAIRPFAEFFASLSDSDSESSVQELRIGGGAQWSLGDVELGAGARGYVFPGRTGRNTSEFFAQLGWNDRSLWGGGVPILFPHLLVAWDPDAGNGGYAEWGIEHTWETAIPQLSVQASAAVAYTYQLRESLVAVADGNGWQHVEAALGILYRLNPLLNLSRASGEWNLSARITHAQHLDDATLGRDVTWVTCRLEWDR